jgi:hypothetical protein
MRESNQHKLIGDMQTQPMAAAGALEEEELMLEGKNLSSKRRSSLKALPS